MIRGGYSYSNWGNLINARYTEDSPLDIELSGRFEPGDESGSLDIVIHAEDEIRWQGLKVRVALTEDSVYYQAPNGTLYHNFTMRDMIPGSDGTAIEIAQDETEYLSFDFDCAEPINWQRSKLVVWVQADVTEKEVLQTAVIGLTELNITSLDEQTALPEITELAQNFPNPFNSNTVIEYSLKSQSEVHLSIYNILGKRVTELVNQAQQPGNYSVIWNGLDTSGKEVAGGVYFYCLNTGDNTINKRMIYLK